MPTLQESYARFNGLPFPAHPDSDELDDWMLELAEADGYISGLAETVLSGGQLPARGVANLDDFQSAFTKISVRSDSDRLIYDQCRDYLKALIDVRDALIVGQQ
jgi:hypothetical protein